MKELFIEVDTETKRRKGIFSFKRNYEVKLKEVIITLSTEESATLWAFVYDLRPRDIKPILEQEYSDSEDIRVVSSQPSLAIELLKSSCPDYNYIPFNIHQFYRAELERLGWRRIHRLDPANISKTSANLLFQEKEELIKRVSGIDIYEEDGDFASKSVNFINMYHYIKDNLVTQ